MNQQVKSHWKLAWRALKTALKVSLSIPYRIHKASLFQLLVNGKIERQRDAFEILSFDQMQQSMRKSAAVVYLEFLDDQINNAVTLREKVLLQHAQKKYLKTFGISKNDLDNGYFQKDRKVNKKNIYILSNK